jgi:flagellar assembly protein FliH
MLQIDWRKGNPLAHAGTEMQGRTTGRIEVFEYLAGPDEPAALEWASWAEKAQAEGAPGAEDVCDSARGAVESAPSVDFEKRLAEETRKAYDAGREQGRQEGRQAEYETQAPAQAAAEQRRSRQAAELIESFASARDRYLLEAEHEVVELALAVAARILRREAQMDPLLLTGAVRVALGQLAGSTEVRLRVPQGDLDLWTEAIGLVPNLTVKPVISAGEGMRLGDCLIETEMGSVDLGIRAQLGEIERGFFDRAGSPRQQPALALEGTSNYGGECGK